MLGATVPLNEGDEKPLGFGGGKKINTSNIRPYYIHFLSLIQKTYFCFPHLSNRKPAHVLTLLPYFSG